MILTHQEWPMKSVIEWRQHSECWHHLDLVWKWLAVLLGWTEHFWVFTYHSFIMFYTWYCPSQGCVSCNVMLVINIPLPWIWPFDTMARRWAQWVSWCCWRISSILLVKSWYQSPSFLGRPLFILLLVGVMSISPCSLILNLVTYKHAGIHTLVLTFTLILTFTFTFTFTCMHVCMYVWMDGCMDG